MGSQQEKPKADYARKLNGFRNRGNNQEVMLFGLSRRRPGFKSPWGRQFFSIASVSYSSPATKLAVWRRLTSLPDGFFASRTLQAAFSSHRYGREHWVELEWLGRRDDEIFEGPAYLGEKNSLKYRYLVRRMELKHFLSTGPVNHQTSGIVGRLPIPGEAQGERGQLRL